jgi:DNA-binding NtrC family response regulator
MSGQGRFRQDLYFRLNGVEIHLPPLRERREDVPALVRHAVGRWCADLGKGRIEVGDPAMMRLIAYGWPGNVRELLNVVHRMVVTASADRIELRDVPPEIRESEGDRAAGGVGSLAGIGLDRLEREAIRQTLAMTSGNREQTAELLGIGERTLYRKLKEYGLR